jgi:gas vesicle protein
MKNKVEKAAEKSKDSIQNAAEKVSDAAGHAAEKVTDSDEKRTSVGKEIKAGFNQIKEDIQKTAKDISKK